MSNKQSSTPFYETASRSINTPARDAVRKEAERREFEILSHTANLTPEQDARLAELQEALLKDESWFLESATDRQAADEQR